MNATHSGPNSARVAICRRRGDACDAPSATSTPTAPPDRRSGSPSPNAVNSDVRVTARRHDRREVRQIDKHSPLQAAPRCMPLIGIVMFLQAAGAPLGAAEPPAARSDPSIVPQGAQLEPLWNEGAFTEGVAVAPDGTIYFSDIALDASPGRILRFDPRTRETSVFCNDSAKSNGLMFDREGRLIACCGANHGGQSLAEITPEGRVLPLVETYQGRRFNAPNDLVIHPDGSIYFSDPRYLGPEPLEIEHMSVYRFDRASGKVIRVTHDISKPNGVVLSPDARTLYVAETDNRTVDLDQTPPPDAKPRMTLNAFPILPDGTLGAKRVLVDFGEHLGIDGMTVDVAGNIYAAVRSPQRFGIRVYDPEGQERAHIPTPELPTNCCFGIGDEASTLYITAGTGLYRIRLKIEGFHPAVAAPG